MQLGFLFLAIVAAYSAAGSSGDTRHKTRGNMIMSRIRKSFHLVPGLRSRKEKNLCVTTRLKEIRIFEAATDRPSCPFCSNSLEGITSSFHESHENTPRHTVSGTPGASYPSPWKWECKFCMAYVLFNEDMETMSLADSCFWPDGSVGAPIKK